MYLVGSIRDNNLEDVEWREEAIKRLSKKMILLNPLAEKHFDEETKTWDIVGVKSSAELIFKQDKWCVDNSDIILANLLCLADEYPTIGSLLELGRAWAKEKLIYLIVPKGYKGHEQSVKMYKLHPFLHGIAAHVFNSVEESLDYLEVYLDVLNGTKPSYRK